MIRLVRGLRGDVRGATLVEFAFVAPVMLFLIMGLGDVLFQAYMQAVLSGAVQKAGRDSTLEGATATSIDNGVISAVKKLLPGAIIPPPIRKNYENFTNVAPEPFVDGNHNGIRDPRECFTDINGNGQWDSDPGVNGFGGASAVQLYTVSVTYARIFPVAGLFGVSKTITLSASTLLKNQPYSGQVTSTPQQVCT